MPFDAVLDLSDHADQERGRAVLREAAALLRTRGHTKLALQDDTGFCFNGAMLAAAIGRTDLRQDDDDWVWVWHSVSSAPYESARRLVEAHRPLDGWIKWNNDADRTGAQVIAAFETMADGGVPCFEPSLFT